MFFFLKQKTAYEMRISDWSSDVCSSDLALAVTLHPQRIGRPIGSDCRRRRPTPILPGQETFATKGKENGAASQVVAEPDHQPATALRQAPDKPARRGGVEVDRGSGHGGGHGGKHHPTPATFRMGEEGRERPRGKAARQ